jgi:hypothetical protein
MYILASTTLNNDCIEIFTLPVLFCDKQMIEVYYKKFVTQSRTGLQIYEGHDDQLNRQEPMA